MLEWVENYLPIFEHDQRYTSFVVSVHKTGRGVGNAFSMGGAFLKILADRRDAYLTRGANSRTRGSGTRGFSYGTERLGMDMDWQLGCCWRTDLSWEKLGRAQARCRALFTQCQRYRVVVSRQTDSKSARTLIDLQISLLSIKLVVHSSKVKVTQGRSKGVQYAPA